MLDFAANICVYFQYLFTHVVCTNIFGANVLKPRFKIDVVVVQVKLNNSQQQKYIRQMRHIGSREVIVYYRIWFGTGIYKDDI